MMSVQGAGGVLLFTSNISTRDQVRSLTTQLQQLSPFPRAIPPLLVTDQEGGTVNRLISIVGPLPPASSLKTTQQAETRGAQDSSFLAELGFNLDLAPVVDVGTANPQLYERTFGSNPDQVAALAGAYLEGLQQSGKVIGTLKHFPGLGDTTTDPHVGLSVLNRSQADWERIDLEPYRVLLKSENVQAIMVTHELVPAVDNQLPASLSPKLVNGVLRGELGYQGVVITDSLYMDALSQRWSVPQAAVLAIKAGADIVIGPSDPQMVQQVIDALKQAIANGTLTLATINTAVSRILALKIRMGLIPLPNQ
jgi:beta-N-acetylhexosaminidase